MINNLEGREKLKSTRTIPSAIQIINENNLSDLDVRCSLSIGTKAYNVTKIYKVLSNILPYSKMSHLAPGEILTIISEKNSSPSTLDEKSIIQHYLGGTDEQINKILNVKQALNFIAEPIVHQVLKGNFELNTEQMIDMMKENYLIGIENNLLDKNALQQFNAKLFATMIQRITTIRDKSYSGAMPNLGLTEQEATEFCVKSVLQECGVFNIVPQSEITPEV